MQDEIRNNKKSCKRVMRRVIFSNRELTMDEWHHYRNRAMTLNMSHNRSHRYPDTFVSGNEKDTSAPYILNGDKDIHDGSFYVPIKD